MSLFRIREWWSTQLGNNDEEFDKNSICTGRIFGSEANRDQIIVGSQSGVIRVLDPGSDLQEDSSVNYRQEAFKAEHLLIEQQLDYPIVQVVCGKFVSNAERDHIAVLHPRKLIVFVLNGLNSSQVEHGAQYTFQKVYEHLLQRTSYNLVSGPFGGVTGRDFFCIQSLDGTLSVYEQENFAFSRFLPGSLLPGPLAYVPMADSFITVSSTWQLESYKYQVLAVAADSQSKEEAANITTGKRVAPDWTYQLGENALDLAVMEISPAQPSVLILGERTLFCLTEGGTVRYVKKLDYNPICFLAYSSTSEGYLQYMIGSDTNTVMVYSDTTLRWTAQLSFTPVIVLRTIIGVNHRGYSLSLGDSGQLICGFLGTDPALYGLPQTDSRLVDFNDRQRELKKLQALIKASSKGLDIKSVAGRPELDVKCVVPSRLDDVSLAYDLRFNDETVPSITVKIVLSANTTFENVQVFLLSPSPVVSHQSAFFFPFVDGTQDLPVTFFVRYAAVPSTLRVKCRVTYSKPGGGSKIVEQSFDLPLSLVSKTTTASKSAMHKITVESSNATVNLNELFQEFLTDSMDGAVQSMGFQLYGPDSVSTSLLVSKNNQKYRVQSDNFESLSLYLMEFIRRLDAYHAASPDFNLSFAGTLPLAEYFALIDHHFELQKRMVKLQEVLAGRCSQYRAVQRQLLTKFKDTTPTPLAHLDGLLEMTHRQVLNIATAVNELQEHIRARSSGLSAATRLLLCLVRLQSSISSSEYDKIESALAPFIDEYPEQTWEERVDASVSHVLQILSKGHAAASPANQNLPKLTDGARLKKHITLLFDKLAKGVVVPETVGIKIPEPAATQQKTNKRLRPPLGGLEPIMEDTNAADATETLLGDAEVPQVSAVSVEDLTTTLPGLLRVHPVDSVALMYDRMGESFKPPTEERSFKHLAVSTEDLITTLPAENEVDRVHPVDSMMLMYDRPSIRSSEMLQAVTPPQARTIQSKEYSVLPEQRGPLLYAAYSERGLVADTNLPTVGAFLADYKGDLIVDKEGYLLRAVNQDGRPLKLCGIVIDSSGRPMNWIYGLLTPDNLILLDNEGRPLTAVDKQGNQLIPRGSKAATSAVECPQIERLITTNPVKTSAIQPDRKSSEESNIRTARCASPVSWIVDRERIVAESAVNRPIGLVSTYVPKRTSSTEDVATAVEASSVGPERARADLTKSRQRPGDRRPISVEKYDRSSVQTMTSRPVQIQRLPSKEKMTKGSQFGSVGTVTVPTAVQGSYEQSGDDSFFSSAPNDTYLLTQKEKAEMVSKKSSFESTVTQSQENVINGF